MIVPPHKFREFIEAPRPAGCQTPIYVLERMVRDTDAWPVFLKLTRGGSGGANNPAGQQSCERDALGHYVPVNRDVVTVDRDSPETIPIVVPEGPSRDRDYKREARTGNSTSYTLRQLERGKRTKDGTVHPPRPDLLEKVKAGDHASRGVPKQALATGATRAIYL